ncbi:LysR family transcriptional regulator [Mameliella alba]|nr:LysR family transcriptional regulator [Antarctobacter heliothermus]MBY6144643.1 LysR family transcriptional regulator [Mameliella alba]MCA0956101.1 LysR family transcriptional regulator [Mameliella alba]
MIENKHMRSFLRVLDLGSFSKAARSLNVAQPALSQHVRKLEDALGARLLDRSAHGVAPTALGREFSTRARDILTQVESAERWFKTREALVSGEVRLGIPGSVCPVLAPPLILAAAKAYPEVRLEISEHMSGDLAGLLREGRMDLAILFSVTATEDFDACPLVQETLHLIGAPDAPLLQAGQVAADQIANAPLVGTRPPHGLRLLLERWASKADIPLNFAFEADSPSVLVRLPASGACYSIVAKTAVAHEIEAGLLGAAEIIDPPIERVACLATSKRLPPNIARDAVQTLLQEVARDLVPKGAWPGGRLI